MNLPNRVLLLTVIGSISLFAGCGGGGGEESPAPPGQGPNPPAAPPAKVTIFVDPVPQSYASLGSSTTTPASGHPTVPPFVRLRDISLEDANQPVLRYTPSGKYEMRVPGAVFDELVRYKGISGPPQEHLLQTESAPQNVVTLVTNLSRFDGYHHSEMANWYERVTPRSGSLAFGTATPSAAIATSGSATYRGRLSGMVDVPYFEMSGEGFFSDATGTVTLTVDFATRTITGTIEVGVQAGPVESTVSFSTGAILAGTDTWWGAFTTSESGFNEFKVMLTGPDASELIGSYAIPVTIDGEPHQFMGAWIAKRQ